MKSKKIRVLKNAIISLLLIFVSLFSSSCIYDPDEAVNIKDCIEIKYVVQADSTTFYFYYDSAEHPIEEYELIKVDLNYYADYKTSMRKKTFVLVVPDDIKQEDNKTYFTVKINDALGKESVIASVSVYANYKTEKKTSNSRWWKYVITIVIALVLLFGLWSIYTTMCEACYSNTILPSFMWLGGLIIYIIVAIIITVYWGSGPGGIIIGGAILYFICTLIPFFKNRR